MNNSNHDKAGIVNAPGIVLPPDPNLASEFCMRLVDMINKFGANLDQDHEVGMNLVSFGQAITFHVTGIGCYNPSLIRFLGRLQNGSQVELIQHVSQISFLLMALKRLNPSEPKTMIGFEREE